MSRSRRVQGEWTFRSDNSPDTFFARCFGCAVEWVSIAPIRIKWSGARRFPVVVGKGAIDWSVDLVAAPATMLMCAVGACLPAARHRGGAVDRLLPQRATSHGPLEQQAFLADFAIPQRGIFVIGWSLLESFDPARHARTVSRHSGEVAVECGPAAVPLVTKLPGPDSWDRAYARVTAAVRLGAPGPSGGTTSTAWIICICPVLSLS